jgi:exopolysaccharide biosynthesis protein
MTQQSLPAPAPSPRRHTRRNFLIGTGLAALVTAGGGAAWAAERFLIPKVEIEDVAAYEAANGSGATSTASEHADSSASATSSATVTDDTYTNGDTSITITKKTTGSDDDTVTYFVANVRLSDATVLRSAFADNSFGENITALTSEIAEENGGVFAINGDYYGFRDTGIVIRNGVAFRDEPARTGLAMYADGTARIYDETSTNADELVSAGDTNFGNHSIQGEQPRTAVGIVDTNHLVLVVVDGRDAGYSRGVTMTELARIMQDLGATTAYNIDGGGSSTMYFNGEVINRPSNGGERATSDILYVAG